MSDQSKLDSRAQVASPSWMGMSALGLLTLWILYASTSMVGRLLSVLGMPAALVSALSWFQLVVVCASGPVLRLTDRRGKRVGWVAWCLGGVVGGFLSLFALPVMFLPFGGLPDWRLTTPGVASLWAWAVLALALTLVAAIDRGADPWRRALGIAIAVVSVGLLLVYTSSPAVTEARVLSFARGYPLLIIGLEAITLAIQVVAVDASGRTRAQKVARRAAL